jgi:hypothetical protein
MIKFIKGCLIKAEKLAALEAELIKSENSVKMIDLRFTEYLSDKRRAERRLEDCKKELLDNKMSDQSKLDDITKFNGELLKTNALLREDKDRLKEDLEKSLKSEQETKALLLETMKLNNSLNSRTTNTVVTKSEPKFK